MSGISSWRYATRLWSYTLLLTVQFAYSSSPLLRGERLSELDGNYRLSEKQLESFIARGFLLIDTSAHFDTKFHRQVAADAYRARRDNGAVTLSNNVAAIVPNVTAVMNCGTVKVSASSEHHPLTDLSGAGSDRECSRA